MALTRDQAIVRVARIIKDVADPPSNQNLTDTEIGEQLDYAVDRYSRDNPDEDVYEPTPSGSSYDFAVPSGWVEDFSVIRSIEYPTGDQEPNILEEDEWTIFKKLDAGTKKSFIRFLKDTPASAEGVRIIWIKPRVLTATTNTVVSNDEYAVLYLAASHCCEVLADKASSASDSTISADAINYRDAQLRYSQQAGRLRKIYFDHMGLPGDV